MVILVLDYDGSDQLRYDRLNRRWYSILLKIMKLNCEVNEF